MNHWKKTAHTGIYDGNTAIREDATPRELMAACFTDPDTNGADIVAQVVGTVSDELELCAEALYQDSSYAETVARMIMRAHDKLKIGLHLRNRFVEADGEEEDEPEKTQLPPGTKRVFLVPLDEDGAPDFDNATDDLEREAMSALGWVDRNAASMAIHVMLSGANSAANIAEVTLGEKPEVAQ